MVPNELPKDLPTFLARFGTDARCRSYLYARRWPQGFCCAGCGHGAAYHHRKRLIEECAACGKQHSLLAGTIFEQTKTGLARWFLAIWLVTSSKGGISALELQRQMGFGSYQTAWAWLHKIRKAMVRPDRRPLAERVEADETIDGRAVDPVPQGTASRGRGRRVGGARPGRRGRGAAGKTVVAGAVEAGRGKSRGRRLGRLRLQSVADASAESLKGFLTANVAPAAAVTTDGWQGYAGLGQAGYDHEAINLRTSWGDAVQHLPAIHLVFGLAKRWLLGTHHGAVSPKHLQAHLDEHVFRFNRRTAKSIGHRFARLVEQAIATPPASYRNIVGQAGAA